MARYLEFSQINKTQRNSSRRYIFRFFYGGFHPMYKKSCELTENNDNNVDNIIIVKHWEGG